MGNRGLRVPNIKNWADDRWLYYRVAFGHAYIPKNISSLMRISSCESILPSLRQMAFQAPKLLFFSLPPSQLTCIFGLIFTVATSLHRYFFFYSLPTTYMSFGCCDFCSFFFLLYNASWLRWYLCFSSRCYFFFVLRLFLLFNSLEKQWMYERERRERKRIIIIIAPATGWQWKWKEQPAKWENNIKYLCSLCIRRPQRCWNVFGLLSKPLFSHFFTRLLFVFFQLFPCLLYLTSFFSVILFVFLDFNSIVCILLFAFIWDLK